MAQLDRRTLLQHAMILVGATAAPALSFEAFATETDAVKQVLDARHFALLSALADTIIPKTETPGALEAGVPKLVDAMFGTWASPDRKAEMVGALDAIDRAALSTHQRSFAFLSPAERLEVLTPYDVAGLKPGPARPGAGSIVDRMNPSYANPGYGKLKDLIVTLFYYSETALTHDLAYEHNPGEWLPSIPITPETRPWGGVGNV